MRVTIGFLVFDPSPPLSKRVHASLGMKGWCLEWTCKCDFEMSFCFF